MEMEIMLVFCSGIYYKRVISVLHCVRTQKVWLVLRANLKIFKQVEFCLLFPLMSKGVFGDVLLKRSS